MSWEKSAGKGGIQCHPFWHQCLQAVPIVMLLIWSTWPICHGHLSVSFALQSLPGYVDALRWAAATTPPFQPRRLNIQALALYHNSSSWSLQWLVVCLNPLVWGWRHLQPWTCGHMSGGTCTVVPWDTWFFDLCFAISVLCLQLSSSDHQYVPPQLLPVAWTA